ncbi:hypothetical protein P0O24_11765 [Methanotrichaceae archaeon M04Ac]|uniref:Uncharacterized protein n=1 Tax=Candidatus Methanocrinis alkalitolerans TaxID=3033395 RepID=A0ABT5XHR2_9EURY|nr:hypothetical protein [Candidatus Methanocrinis alkalitolerans]MDF0594255.1 hypothetical protein [Candidatus Methanocrinis alkalitolerans]
MPDIRSSRSIIEAIDPNLLPSFDTLSEKMERYPGMPLDQGGGTISSTLEDGELRTMLTLIFFYMLEEKMSRGSLREMGVAGIISLVETMVKEALNNF